jgi:phosphopantetheinyl transferase
MQYISYKISSESIRMAEEYFPPRYIEKIRQKNTYEQSLVARYEISRLVEQYYGGIVGFLPEVDMAGKPISRWALFWSISHSQDHVLVGVSNQPIWVDIEVIRPRDESLFDSFSQQEWDILGERAWESFYILWSAKEALVKKYLWWVDEIGKWGLVVVEVVWVGEWKLSFSDGYTIEVVSSEVRDGVVKSICG